MANEEALRGELKALIVRALRLDGLTSERLTDDSLLFGGDFGLDSVDALELVVALEKAYGITVRSHEVAKDDFASVRSLARFVARALDGAASPIGQNAT
jgi:acyl carrier protein